MPALSKNKEQDEALPEKFRKYFWEYRGIPLNIGEDATLITERILTFGNPESLHWLLNCIDLPFLKKTISKSRKLDAKTLNYWKLILNE